MLLELKEVTIPTLDQKCVIVNDVSFGIKDGSIHAIIGPNGSGKSTLAYTIMGLGDYKALKGKIYFDGIDITNLSITERAGLGITLAWQEPARIDGLSVHKYVSLGMKDKSKMRVELAAAIAMRPRLIILDEPDSGLDFIVLEDFMNIFEKIKKLNMTILLITHREDIGMVADYGTLLWRGDHIITDVFPKVMLRYCAKAGLKEFCKRTLFKNGAVCFDDDYIDRIFREEGLS